METRANLQASVFRRLQSEICNRRRTRYLKQLSSDMRRAKSHETRQWMASLEHTQTRSLISHKRPGIRARRRRRRRSARKNKVWWSSIERWEVQRCVSKWFSNLMKGRTSQSFRSILQTKIISQLWLSKIAETDTRATLSEMRSAQRRLNFVLDKKPLDCPSSWKTGKDWALRRLSQAIHSEKYLNRNKDWQQRRSKLTKALPKVRRKGIKIRRE